MKIDKTLEERTERYDEALKNLEKSLLEYAQASRENYLEFRDMEMDLNNCFIVPGWCGIFKVKLKKMFLIKLINK